MLILNQKRFVTELRSLDEIPNRIRKWIWKKRIFSDIGRNRNSYSVGHQLSAASSFCSFQLYNICWVIECPIFRLISKSISGDEFKSRSAIYMWRNIVRVNSFLKTARKVCEAHLEKESRVKGFPWRLVKRKERGAVCKERASCV